ncbi:MAG: serine/threonine protein phosphatase [Clostridiales bacterium]|nr:serine/threonine protein phosphatase [Clostridiales bacterium]
MTYVMSDLHGCYDKYLRMLKIIDLKDEDTLYILGDIVDRGDEGLRLALDLRLRENVVVLRGNHDYTALTLLRQLEVRNPPEGIVEIFNLWFSDGGNATYIEYRNLTPEERKNALSFLNFMAIYEAIEVGSRSFFLAHTVPERERFLSFDSCTIEDFIMGEPDYEEVYLPEVTIVTGHTPTSFIDEEYRGRIWHGNNHIAVDCAAVFGNPLGCICLDTMKEYYTD